ncbi:MAG TPA: GNAT family N-acetyltransferase [Pyrinomonadaceae bacterium]|jgi:phosphinothricin acetyltransferase|nr:GNAT family N-acetyltransferase [Pyrinomonadaceae bacterium]
MKKMTIEAMQPQHWPQAAAIYQEGIATGQATFETAVPSFEHWDRNHLRIARFIASQGGIIVGWAALSPVSQRQVYAGVAEVSVYVAATSRGSGVGRQLLEALIDESERNGIWTLQAGIFPENAASIALHLACGFREVGRRERIGNMNGEWRDTLLFERRSSRIGSTK